MVSSPASLLAGQQPASLFTVSSANASTTLVFIPVSGMPQLCRLVQFRLDSDKKINKIVLLKSPGVYKAGISTCGLSLSCSAHLILMTSF